MRVAQTSAADAELLPKLMLRRWLAQLLDTGASPHDPRAKCPPADRRDANRVRVDCAGLGPRLNLTSIVQRLYATERRSHFFAFRWLN